MELNCLLGFAGLLSEFFEFLGKLCLDFRVEVLGGDEWAGDESEEGPETCGLEICRGKGEGDKGQGREYRCD